MTPAATPIFTLATEKPLPAETFAAEAVIGGRRYESSSQCERRGGLILADADISMTMGGGHAAQEALIEGIRKANADGCAVEIRAFHY